MRIDAKLKIEMKSTEKVQNKKTRESFLIKDLNLEGNKYHESYNFMLIRFRK